MIALVIVLMVYSVLLGHALWLDVGGIPRSAAQGIMGALNDQRLADMRSFYVEALERQIRDIEQELEELRLERAKRLHPSNYAH